MKGQRALLICLLAYGTASLAHHIYNAEFLAEYPNMPAWLSPAKVYLAWTVETAVGLIGYVLLRAGYRLPGLVLIGAYAVAGFPGLDHYPVAPLAPHTPGRHLST